ncbi:carbon-nitrogen hydrolase family protein [Skermania piniformis]|uniref:Carbon-nitrogen hydrolase family protein n=1 Tax=Skermania pinensis TaxID=39122 RepID=A0ABX8S6X4_9ACTN|nr:carbon-nitrogen hydrolase family protein [Skermania piniformis]QXQ13011.1 carbon-nitrogen hydrolase family protein [Skermania piniformis]
MESDGPEFPVAVTQFTPGTDVSANLAAVRDAAHHAADRGARLIVAPEYAMFTAPKLDRRVVDAAEPLDGRFVTGLLATATDTGLFLVAGMAERNTDPDRISNTLVVAAPDGSLAAVYRKLHLYDAFGFTESAVVCPGELTEPATFAVDGLTFGLQTCYDLRFPESIRRVVDAGAQAVVLPAQWVPGPLKEDHWITLIRARAIENTIYLLAADQAAPYGAGHSMIVDPMGVILTGLGDRSGVAVGTVSARRLADVRRRNPALELRRLR